MASGFTPEPDDRRNTTASKKTINQAIRLKHISPSMADALSSITNANGPGPGTIDFYRLQSNQEIGLEQFSVPVYFKPELDATWKSPLKDAMKAINNAAPGLKLNKINEERKAKILVDGNNGEECWTELKNVLTVEKNQSVTITLGKAHSAQRKNGTAIHEIMHALGFEHEHQRRDRNDYLIYDQSKCDKEWDAQYKVLNYAIGLSRFDPHSIMMYSLCEALKLKPEGETVWKIKPRDEQRQVLSELDKVGLNILYRPVEHAGYHPNYITATGLMYCGCKDFVQVGYKTCGPERGANCPACRVLQTKKSKEINELDKWQGWTGLVYCGKQKGEGKGLCGPDERKPCKECRKLIGYYDDSPEDQDVMQ